MPIEISSPKNPRIKFLTSLQQTRERKATGLFVIEGIREISLAKESGYEISTLVVCDAFYTPDKEYPVSFDVPEVLKVPALVFSKLAYRESSGGLIAVAKMKTTLLDGLKIQNNSLFLILEKIEKPGNLGAMLRTADAAGLSGVIIADPATDIYNPNVVRSSIGCLFTVPVATAENAEVLKWCKKYQISTYAASLEASVNYTSVDFRNSSAIVLGAESDGLSNFWIANSDERIVIPMHGKIDSMNVSNAAAIIIFEALRQRS